MSGLVVASLACAAWIYVLLLRGGFWRAAERDDVGDGANFVPTLWPRVVAIVPARNEAEVIAASIGSLLQQEYPGRFAVIVVDDHSSDDTAAIARAAVAAVDDRLVVLPAPALPEPWTGKLWAMNCGASYASALPEPSDYLLFVDADITCAPDTLTSLVKRAEPDGPVLVSLMAKLHCESFVESALIPAFIFFFQLLYPFAWVNRAERSTAAAAGGCMLVRRTALERAGGLAVLRAELIDDCALGRLLKKQGPIWLGLTDRVRSLRAFGSIGDIRPMISRSAYAQLQYSPWLLIGTAVSIALTCLAPPLLALGSVGTAQWLGGAAWMLMALAMQPILRFYGVSRWWGVALPAIAFVYLAFTLDSAWQHWRGRGGLWKGRAHCPAPDRR